MALDLILCVFCASSPARRFANEAKSERTRDKLELLINNNTVVGVVAASDLATVEAVAENPLDWSIGEFNLDVATEAGSGLSRHDSSSW